MFHLQANKIYLEVCAKEGVTSGSVNVYTVRFSFNSDWDGLDRTAVFHAGDDQISVVLDDSNECQIPWEVLENPGRNLSVGVYGTKGGTVVLPTIWAQLGEIREGVSLGSNAQPPTPDVYSQILEAAEQAEKIAQSVRDDADAGKFDGEPGPEGPQGPPGDGVPEITPEDEGKFLGILDGAAEGFGRKRRCGGPQTSCQPRRGRPAPNGSNHGLEKGNQPHTSAHRGDYKF